MLLWRERGNKNNKPIISPTLLSWNTRKAGSSAWMSRLNPGPRQPIPSTHSLSSSHWTFGLRCDVLKLPRDCGKDSSIEHGQPPSTQTQTLRSVRRNALELDWSRFTFEYHFGHFTCVTLGTWLLCLLVWLHWSGNIGDSSFWRLSDYFKVPMYAFLLIHVSILF